ncbi:Serine/threonine-protein kinase pim-3 [Acropora cervicornis]|uniref:Serine/threonine-protein kinase pim-3 n=1 Tax=Acropora cervicornis TaxID=6130 RepID=A0AAD9PVL8_ACRCE|nr:Serine/threonine-protein kinase pim-3 [Acropora cervicornis]
MYLIQREKLSLKRACPASRNNQEREKVSDLKVAKVSGNMCNEFRIQGVKETFTENFEQRKPDEDHQKEDYQDEFRKKLSRTKAYMPPEFVRFGWYDGSQSTVWALGMILVNLLSSSMPFRKPEEALSRSPRLKANLSQSITMVTSPAAFLTSL